MRGLYIISQEEFDFNILERLEGWTIVADKEHLRKLYAHETIFLIENKRKNVRIFFSKRYGCYSSINILPIIPGDENIYEQSYDMYNNKSLLKITDDIIYKLCIDINDIINIINKNTPGTIEAVCTMTP
ncbi:hypothetical protein [Filifactor alocis]|uniref:hypothetical protein n=1 Tax=Filifactor alocis TaxID=143361 RepID=UPI003F9FE2B2